MYSFLPFECVNSECQGSQSIASLQNKSLLWAQSRCQDGRLGTNRKSDFFCKILLGEAAIDSLFRGNQPTASWQTKPSFSGTPTSCIRKSGSQTQNTKRTLQPWKDFGGMAGLSERHSEEHNFWDLYRSFQIVCISQDLTHTGNRQSWLYFLNSNTYQILAGPSLDSKVDIQYHWTNRRRWSSQQALSNKSCQHWQKTVVTVVLILNTFQTLAKDSLDNMFDWNISSKHRPETWQEFVIEISPKHW